MLEKPDSVRPAVLGFEPYSPGLSIDEIRQRYGLARIIKMASNENPLGVSPLVREAIRQNAGLAFRYTQSGNPRLVRAVADFHGVAPENVVLGNGSDEVIDLLIRCRAEPGVHNVVASLPCFSLYPLQSRLCGVELRRVSLNSDFSFNWQGLLEQADRNTALLFITTPDNPSGFCPPASQVEALAHELAKRSPGALLAVDEAYMDLTGAEAGHSLLPRFAEFKNIAILRTFSKSFGLAGLRLGYGIMPPALADYLCRVRLPFSVNCLAEAAGLAALLDKDFLHATLQVVLQGRKELTDNLRSLGCTVPPSLANFLIFRLPGDSRLTPDQLFTALLERGIIIRQLKSYCLPEYLRVSVGNAEENRLFLQAVKELIG